MTQYSYLDFEISLEDNMPAGSPLITRFGVPYPGSKVNDGLAALASALRNLGDQAAKYSLDGDGAPILGPKGGRVGSMAWQDADDVDISVGLLGSGVRGSMPIKSLINWLGSWAELSVIYYTDLVPRGWVVCDGRTETNPYPPNNQVTVPNLLGLYAYFFDDVGQLGSTQFAHTKTTSEAGAHAHTGSTGAVALTGAHLPTLARTKAVQSGAGAGVVDEYSGVGAGHAHAIAADGTHFHTVDVRPASIVVVPLLRCW